MTQEPADRTPAPAAAVAQLPDSHLAGAAGAVSAAGPSFRWGTRALESADSVVYLLVGSCFLLAAALSLLYSLYSFGVSAFAIVQSPHGISLPSAAQAIITFVSDLLLTLIILEVMGTVVHYLQTRATSLKPFLFIGIISATRGILAVGARLSVTDLQTMGLTELRNSMVALGVNAAVIIALGVTLRLIGRYLDDTPTIAPTDGDSRIPDRL